MKIEKETLDKLAHLARLEYDEKDSEKMLADLNNMVAFVEKLKEVDTTGVEPLTTMSHEINAMREDQVQGQLTREEALANAPKKDTKFFRVPKVLE
jgi:aspartyl-tRNA(Asn)/glutamyl-tRNA(Gln) amidotransferase subunit C